MTDDRAGRANAARPRRRALLGLALCTLATLAACHVARARQAPIAPPQPSAPEAREVEPSPRSAGRYLISLDPWKAPVTWFCFKNLKNPEDPSVCVQTEDECNLELSLKKKYSDANGVAFEGSKCKRAEDPHCTFMYVREGRAAPTDTGKRATWTVSEKVNTCCNYICSETAAECEKQVDQFRSVVLRENEREREQMSCDIPCRRWSAFPAEHDKD